MFIFGGILIFLLLWWMSLEVAFKRGSENRSLYKAYYNLLNQWLKNKNCGKSIASYFENNSMNSCAIYGMGELGERLYEELINTDLKILYITDKTISSSYKTENNIDYLKIDDISAGDSPDIIIVTPFYVFDKIQSSLLNKGYRGQIISIADIILEVGNY